MRHTLPTGLLATALLLWSAWLSAQSEPPALNDASNYYTYGTSTLAAVEDATAVEGDAIQINYGGEPGGAFSTAMELVQDAAAVDAAGDTHTITFRYRADAPRTIIFYTTSRERGMFDGDQEFGGGGSYYELAATSEYQTFTTEVTSPLVGGEPERIVHLQFTAGNSNVPYYIDAVDVTTVSVPTCSEDDRFNGLTSYNFYPEGSFTTAIVDDATAECGDAFEVQYTGTTGGGDFSAGFQILQSASADDAPGLTHTISFRYRAAEARQLIFYTTSRPRGTFGSDDLQFAEGSYDGLQATTEWQTFTKTYTSPRTAETATGDDQVYMLWPSGNDAVPFYLDDVSVVTEGGPGGPGPGDCTEGAPNVASNYGSFFGNASVAEVSDEDGFCGNALAITFSGDADNADLFSEGAQLAESVSLPDLPGNEYRIGFRYRADAPDTMAIYVPSRKRAGGDITAFFSELALTTEYQTLEATFTSPREPGETEQFIYIAFGVGGLSTTAYVDSFFIEQTNEPCDEGVLKQPSSYAGFDASTIAIAQVDDEAAECGDAIEACNTGTATPDNNFSQGVQIVDERRLPDLPGKRFRLSLRYRTDAPEPVNTGFYFSSRTPDNQPDANGVGEVNTAFASVTLTGEYQTLDFEFDSALAPGQSNRFLHWSLGIGAVDGCVYLDDVTFEDISPARTENVTLYVQPGGSDGNTGRGPSATEAFATVAYAFTQLIPGDTLELGDGVYAEGPLTLRGLVSTADAPTVVRAANRWGAKLEGIEQFGTLLQVEDCEHVIVEGLEAYHPGETTETDWATGFQAFGSDYVTFRDNYAHDCGCGGFSGREGDYFTFERNVAVGNARTNPFNCSGISVYQPIQRDDAAGPHIVIRDNVVFGNECRLAFTPLGFTTPTDGNGIILDDFEQTQSFGGGTNPNDPFRALTLIENNLSFRNGGAGIKAFEVANVSVINNTVYHNNYVLEEFTGNLGEIGMQTITGTVDVTNNIAVKAFGQRGNALYFSRRSDGEGEAATLNATANLFVGPNQLVSGTRNVSGNTSVSEDRQSFPAFANPVDTVTAFASVEEFRQYFGLRQNSPAQNSGLAAVAPPADLSGVSRPQGSGVELGAFEGVVEGDGPLEPDPTLVAEVELTPAALQIDGQRDGFYTGPNQLITKNLAAEPTDADDLSAEWTSAYDAEKLYVLVTVTDEEVGDGDAVTLFLDGDNAKGMSYDANDLALEVTAAGTSADVAAIAGASVAATGVDGGYAVEVAVPWSALGVAAADGVRFGIDVQVADTDTDDDPSVLSWQAIAPGADTDPSVFGEGLLVAVEPPPAIAFTEGITVDGVAEAAWDTVVVYDLEREVQPTVDSPDDLAADWRAVYDSTNLYFYVRVTDDAVVDDSEQWFNDDGVEIYIDADNSKTFNDYDANDYQIVIETNGRIYDTKGQLGEGAVATVTLTATGYDVEVALPWTALAASPDAGLFIGVDVHAIDDDDGDARDGKLAWFAEIDQSFSNAALFGTAYLAPPAEAPPGEPEGLVLPGRIEAEDFEAVTRPSVEVVADDEGDAAVRFATNRSRVDYEATVQTAGFYLLTYRVQVTRGRSAQVGLYFGENWWQRQVARFRRPRDVGNDEWFTVERIAYLPEGPAQLAVEARNPNRLVLDYFEGELLLPLGLQDVRGAGPDLALEPVAADALTVFPNPAISYATVILPDVDVPTDISVFDVQGRLVRFLPQALARVEMPVDDLPSGAYLVLVETSRGPAVQRLVVE